MEWKGEGRSICSLWTGMYSVTAWYHSNKLSWWGSEWSVCMLAHVKGKNNLHGIQSISGWAYAWGKMYQWGNYVNNSDVQGDLFSTGCYIFKTSTWVWQTYRKWLPCAQDIHYKPCKIVGAMQESLRHQRCTVYCVIWWSRWKQFGGLGICWNGALHNWRMMSRKQSHNQLYGKQTAE